MVGLAGLLLNDPGTAEEVVQDAFARFHLVRHRIVDPEREVAYLRSIVCNLARGRLRRWGLERRKQPPPDATSTCAPTPPRLATGATSWPRAWLVYPVASASAWCCATGSTWSVTLPPPSASPRGRSSRTCIAAWPRSRPAWRNWAMTSTEDLVRNALADLAPSLRPTAPPTRASGAGSPVAAASGRRPGSPPAAVALVAVAGASLVGDRDDEPSGFQTGEGNTITTGLDAGQPDDGHPGTGHRAGRRRRRG